MAFVYGLNLMRLGYEQKIQNNERTEGDAVVAEAFKVVLLYKIHEEFY